MRQNRIFLLSFDVKAVSLISHIAESLGYIILHYQDGLNFRTVVEDYNPTLIIIDLNYGKFDGIELINYISSMGCKIPIIMIGDYDEKILLSTAYIAKQKNLNVIATVKSPFTESDIHKALTLSDEDLNHIDNAKIVSALENNHFVVYYQPKIEIKSNKIIGVEALIRWQPPQHDLIPPDAFIPIAESSEIIVPLTYWVINQSLKEYAEWKSLLNKIQLSINLSTKSLIDLAFPDEIIKICESLQILPQNICFEITESATMKQPDLVLEVLTRLRLLGFHLSIDDFGTGYSSLVELQRLPFTELKIDKSFITNLISNKLNITIVKSIIYLARSMNMKTVAEGVETKEVLEVLGQYDCDIAQGYYFARPKSNAEITKWVSQYANQPLTLGHQ